MKVLQILPELNGGGVERGTLELGRYLAAHGHESLVVSAGGRMVAQLEEEGSRHISLPVGQKSFAVLGAVVSLRNLIVREQPDIVHVRSRLPAWVVAAAWKLLGNSQRPKLVSTVHGLYSVKRYSEQMTRADAVICVSESAKNYVIENYPKCSEERLCVIHRGVDPSEFPRGYEPMDEWRAEFASAFPATVGKQLVTLPGRITQIKGHLDFLRILSEIDDPSVHGLIVGGTHPKRQGYADEVRAEVERLGLAERVTFTGQRSDIRDIFAISDVVLSLTTKPESFGRTVLEALAIGTPVTGYDHGGVGEILRRLFPDGLVPLRDTTSAVVAIKKQLARETSEPLENEAFLLDDCLRKTVEVYEGLLRDVR